MRSRGVVLLLCLTAAAAAAQPARNLPLPSLAAGVQLRVAYVENARLPALPAERLNDVLARTVALVRAHLGIEARFSAPVRLPIEAVFAGVSRSRRESAEAHRLDPAADAAALEPLVPAFVRDLREAGDVAAQKKFAASYLVEPPADGGDAGFARALLWTQHSLLSAWHRSTAADGRPLLGADRYNEYMYWFALGSIELPYEVIVTNQLIASAERIDNSVHSAIRGGVSNGITTQSRAARFGLMSILATFPFTDASPLARRLRRGDQPSDAQANEYMALMLTHELGHQLLHLGHPFANSRCVMTPPVALEFREWARSLDPAGCALGSSRPNTPGFIKFETPARLFR